MLEVAANLRALIAVHIQSSDSRQHPLSNFGTKRNRFRSTQIAISVAKAAQNAFSDTCLIRVRKVRAVLQLWRLWSRRGWPTAFHGILHLPAGHPLSYCRTRLALSFAASATLEIAAPRTRRAAPKPQVLVCTRGAGGRGIDGWYSGGGVAKSGKRVLGGAL